MPQVNKIKFYFFLYILTSVGFSLTPTGTIKNINKWRFLPLGQKLKVQFILVSLAHSSDHIKLFLRWHFNYMNLSSLKSKKEKSYVRLQLAALCHSVSVEPYFSRDIPLIMILKFLVSHLDLKALGNGQFPDSLNTIV